jgi:tetratricopeptide (TPR) repeat protein
MPAENRMGRCLQCFLPVLALTGFILSAGAAAQQTQGKYNPGDRVVAVRDSVLRVPAGPVDEVWPGVVLKVSVVNGNWLWVSLGKPGWIDSADVVPLGPQAIMRMSELINALPDSARLYSGRAAVWRELGELDKALEDCNKAIRLEPRSAEYLNNRGFMLTEMGEFDKAIKDFDGAIALDPNHAEAYDNRGLAWGAQGAYDKAIQDHTAAIKLDRQNSRFYNNRGNAYSAIGQYAKAIDDFNEAIRLDPQEAVAYNNRGNARYFRKEYEKAVVDFGEAIRLDPTDPVAYNSRAVLRATCPEEKYRDGKKAIEDAKKACELTEWKDPEALDTLAAANAEAGDFAKAIEWQRKAIELADEDDKADLQARLALYQDNKPFRQGKNETGP